MLQRLAALAALAFAVWIGANAVPMVETVRAQVTRAAV